MAGTGPAVTNSNETAPLIALPQQKLDALLSRHSLLESELATSLSAENYVKLSREFSELGPVIEAIKAYRAVSSELADLDAMIADAATDGEMRRLAEAEKPALQERLEYLERQIGLALVPKDAMDERNVIIEIRAGTGGDEAALFAGDLFRMYERYAALQGWKVEILSLSEGTKGGFKEIIAEIRGRGAFAKLKFESGVHRVQRVPETEASGRIHTSAATVAVLPEVEDVDIDINEADLEDRHHARAGRRRPARQQDRIGDPHHPHAERHRGAGAGGALAAQEQGQGHDHAARQAVRPGAQQARQRARGRAARPGRIGRPLGTHPHL